MTPAALAALHSAAFTEERAWSETEFASLHAAKGVFVLGDPRHAALGRVVLDEVELLTLAVHPDHRRQGLARDLLATFEETARAHGAKTAFLEVRAGNRAANALYAAAGYGETGRRKRYYTLPDGTRDDAILRAKPLLP
ncbi:GNAT family N-acetyltransferase [Pseudaestuariivita sp.]|uniref:GNAT family N-acetyltransferase n=1 Tax=Pseudaestuariivita sp. TaxID=2211669 RepID=UPI0040594BC6